MFLPFFLPLRDVRLVQMLLGFFFFDFFTAVVVVLFILFIDGCDGVSSPFVDKDESCFCFLEGGSSSSSSETLVKFGESVRSFSSLERSSSDGMGSSFTWMRSSVSESGVEAEMVMSLVVVVAASLVAVRVRSAMPMSPLRRLYLLIVQREGGKCECVKVETGEREEWGKIWFLGFG